MPEAAVSGLVEGLLQGHAIRQQKKQQAEEKERQHALDIFQQHAQQWREQTQAQQYASDQEQLKTQNALAERQQKGREDEEARKVAADKARQDLLRDSQNAKTEKQKQDLYFKAIGKDMGYTPEQATALTGYSPPALSGGGAAPTPQQPGLQNALSILGQAGQGQAPIPGGGIGANGARPDILSMLQGSADATGARPETRMPGYMPSNIGQSPVAAANIKAKNAQAGLAGANTTKAQAQTQFIQDKDAFEIVRTAGEKIRQDLDKKKGKKTDAETATIEALRQPKADLMSAQKQREEAQLEVAGTIATLNTLRAQYLPLDEKLKAEGMALRQESNADRRKNMESTWRLHASDRKRTIQADRTKAEQAYGKLNAQRIYQQGIKAINPATVDPIKGEATLRAIQAAPEIIKNLDGQMEQLRTHINELGQSGADVEKILADTTTAIHPSGVPDPKATDAARKAAADAAKSPPKLPALNPDFPFVSPGAGRTASRGAHPKVQAVAPGKTSGSNKTGKLKTMTDAELDALRKKLEQHK